MGKLIDYFVNRSLLVNLISLIIVLVGIFSIFNLQKETFPRVDFETITITTTYPGASAEDVEKLVSIPIERELKDVEGVEEMNVLSGEGYSIAVLKVDQDYLTDDVLDDARNAVDSVDDLPTDVERPTLKKIENKLRPIIKVGITGDEEWELRKLSKKLRDKLERVKGIAKADLVGYREELFDVAVDPQKLLALEITMAEVTAAIRDRNTNIAGGSIKKDDREVIVRTLKEYEDKQDIERVVVRSNSSGSNVKVYDLAKVQKVLKVEDEKIRAKGKMTVILNVVAKSKANVISTTDAVKEATEEFVSKLNNPAIGYTYFDDLSFFVKRRLNVLTKNGMQGMILVFFCLLLFLNFRVSLMTSLGAPLAFLVSFALMEYMGISINLISMFGLILVLGMLVDDSIIVSENFYQYLEKDYEPHEAAKLAAKETVAPVTATILTTMVAFGALFFMGGIMGKFLWPVPAVVIICLLASWVECFFILPSHLSDFVKISKNRKEKTWYKSLMKVYERILTFCLSWRKLTVLTFFLVFVSSIATLFTMDFELFPGDDVQVLNLKIRGKVGTPVEQTQEVVSKLEKIVLEELNENELMNLYATIGSLKSPHTGKKLGSHYGQLLIHLTMQDFRERKTEEIINIISKKSKAVSGEFKISIDKQAGGPPKGKPVNVELSGESLKELKVYSAKIQNLLKEQKGVLATELDYEEGKLQYIIDINEEEARRLGLTNKQIALEIRRAYEGEVATVIRQSDDDIDITVRLNEEARSSEKALDQLFILNNLGNRIALNKISTIRKEPGSFVIRRFNRKRTFSISAEIDKRTVNAFALNKAIAPKLDKLLAESDLTYQLTGENKDTEESMENFKRASIISMLLIFIILVAMFSSLGQPLIIMLAIPLGLIGVIFIFKIFNMPIGFMAMMGIIGLVGVVVNDSIVLVSFINNGLKKSNEVFETIKEACLSRFRPVILTTFTTVAGLLPLAHTPGGDPFLKPMAISFAYGLIFSTTLTLLFVPCVYFIYENLRRKFSSVEIEG